MGKKFVALAVSIALSLFVYSLVFASAPATHNDTGPAIAATRIVDQSASGLTSSEAIHMDSEVIYMDMKTIETQGLADRSIVKTSPAMTSSNMEVTAMTSAAHNFLRTTSYFNVDSTTFSAAEIMPKFVLGRGHISGAASYFV